MFQSSILQSTVYERVMVNSHPTKDRTDEFDSRGDCLCGNIGCLMVGEPDDVLVALEMWVEALRKVATATATPQTPRKAETIPRTECLRNQA